MGVFNRPRLELSTLLTLHWLELRKCPHKRAREIRNLYLWDQEVENKCIVEQLVISAQTTFLLIHIYVCTLPTGDIYFPQRRQSKVLFTYHRQLKILDLWILSSLLHRCWIQLLWSCKIRYKGQNNQSCVCYQWQNNNNITIIENLHFGKGNIGHTAANNKPCCWLGPVRHSLLKFTHSDLLWRKLLYQTHIPDQREFPCLLFSHI